MSPSQAHLDYARNLCRKWGEDRIRYVCPRSPILNATWRRVGGVIPPKLLTLAMLAPMLSHFDAIAVPERTSIILKWMGIRSVSFIHLDHGAGDGAAGFDRRIKQFDFVLMAGEKHRARLLKEGLIRVGAHAVVGYPKFEAADAARDPSWTPFPGDTRPIVLYNPHFSNLGSWKCMGESVLREFADQDRYNLIVAPHVRLLDKAVARQRWSKLLSRYEQRPHIYIDPGSDRSIDMTYTMLADVYLGDVSSQVYEFIRIPRPCLFLNSAKVDWKDNENFGHWHFGPVLYTTNDLIEQIDAARAGHEEFADRQLEGLRVTFSEEDRPPSERAADAIGWHMTQRYYRTVLQQRWQIHLDSLANAVKGFVQRAAVIMPALVAGWLLHDLIQPSNNAVASNFVDEVVTSYQVLLMRDVMRSQLEVSDFEPDEIHAFTGIAMPSLQKDWQIRDVQVFPSNAGPSVQLLIETAENDKFAIVVMKGVDTPADQIPLLEKRRTEEIAYWEQNGNAIAIVSDSPKLNPLQIASFLVFSW